LLDLGRIGAGRKRPHSHQPPVARFDGLILVIDLGAEQFLAASQERPGVPVGLHSNHIGTEEAVQNAVAPALRDQLQRR
jgi:hypothetical protein